MLSVEVAIPPHSKTFLVVNFQLSRAVQLKYVIMRFETSYYDNASITSPKTCI